ncbi:ribokinase [Nocardioides sp. GXQ0305]|uniref:ribokinase n=1 Tax=Nocardioides sp. GXQ0305 TaxID=3423912 RepID=UPI003D7EE716
MGRVVVLGSLNVDLVTRVRRLPRAGETVAGDDLQRHPGGKGANQAVAAARAGAETCLVGACGTDEGGELVVSALVADGVDVSGVRRLADVPTGTATILVEDGGENVIAIGPGANARWESGDVAAGLRGTTTGDVLLVQLEVPLPVTREAARTARRAGARVVLNAAPLDGPVPGLLGDIDLLVVNEHEARAVARGSDGTVEELAAGLAERERLDVVVTLGAEGALLCRPGRTPVRCPAPPVEALDTVGAGDTFTGYLAAALAAGEDHHPAVRRAVTAASIAVTRVGAQTAIPRTTDLTDPTPPEDDHETSARQ